MSTPVAWAGVRHPRAGSGSRKLTPTSMKLYAASIGRCCTNTTGLPPPLTDPFPHYPTRSSPKRTQWDQHPPHPKPADPQLHSSPSSFIQSFPPRRGFRSHSPKPLNHPHHEPTRTPSHVGAKVSFSIRTADFLTRPVDSRPVRRCRPHWPPQCLPAPSGRSPDSSLRYRSARQH